MTDDHHDEPRDDTPPRSVEPPPNEPVDEPLPTPPDDAAAADEADDKGRPPLVVLDGDDLDLTPEDLAIIALVSGVAGLIFAVFGFGTWPHLLALPLALVAIGGGYQALQSDHRREKQAVAGLVCGLIGLCFWLIASAHAEFRLLIGG